jgi:dipeptidyl aminopeptidase/acylaminoacyl peptidase
MLSRILPLLVSLTAAAASISADTEKPAKPAPVRIQSDAIKLDGPAQWVALSPDAKYLAVAGAGKTIRLWDLASIKEMGKFPVFKDEVLALAFSPDGKTLVSAGADMTLRFWQLDPVKQLRQAEVKEGTLNAVAFSGDGKMVATGGEDRMARVWDADKASEIQTLSGHASGVTAVAFSPDGKTLASGGKDRTVRFWDLDKGKERTRYRSHFNWITALAYAPDGQTLASAGRDQAIVLWDVIAERQRLRLQLYDGPIFSALFTPDGAALVAGSKDAKLHSWDLASASELTAADGHKGPVLALCLSKDGKTLASSDEKGAAIVWEATNLPRADGEKKALTAKELGQMWNDFASDDEATVYSTVQAFTARPKQAVEFLGKQLKGPAPLDADRIDKLLRDLDNDDFETREKAQQELQNGGELVEKALKKIAMEKKLPIEAERRVAEVLQVYAGRSVYIEQRCQRGALEVLERLGTPEAKKVLQTFADGPADAFLTREAKASLDRFAKRAAAKP